MKGQPREVWTQKTSNGWWQVVADGWVRCSFRGQAAKGTAAAAESMLRIAASILDDHIPQRGPCAFCAGSDQTHRVIDSIASMTRAELKADPDLEDYGWVAEEFGYADSVELVDACLTWSDDGRAR